MKHLLILVITLVSVDVFACRCIPRDSDQYIEDADVVIEATADGFVTDPNKPIRKGYLTIRKVIKGDLDNIRKIAVSTGLSSASCGYEMIPKKKYLLHLKFHGTYTEDFQYLENLYFHTSTCSGNQEIK